MVRKGAESIMAREQVSSILRAIRILECFTDSETEWTLKALVERLDLPTTTVFRQVSTLTDQQYLIQDPIRNLSILLEHDIFYLDKVETHRSIVCNTRIGSLAPAYATSCGKVILANQGDEAIDRFCLWMRDRARSLTARTITDPDRLRQELMEARARGYATDNGEIEAGLICYGAPVYDMNRKVTAAVSVSGPEYRMQEERDMMIQEVKRTAENISRLLGCLHAPVPGSR